jgi:BASS family bile acid:Na+ symporter
MPIAIAIIMFGIGINLSFKDFAQIFVRPKAVIAGLVAQMIMLPAIAFLLNEFWDISPLLKVGFILIAACPGGTTSNLVTLFLKGRLALSVTLTAFNSFLILFTIPLIVNLALLTYMGREAHINLPFTATLLEIFLSVLLPTIAGMLLKQYKPATADSLTKPLNYVMTGFLFVVFLGIIFFENEGNQSIWRYSNIFFPAFMLNLTTMFAGYLLSLLVGIRNRGRFTIAIQVGLQNSALAIYVASKMLGQTEMAMVAVVYGSFTLFSTALWAWIMKKYL